MDYLSARWQRLWEAMESCRGGNDDLSDPQFADLAGQLAENPELRVQFQRLQQADKAVKVAFANVPVPAGLADRISRRLAEAGSREQGAESNVQAASVTVSEELSPIALAAASPAPLRKETGRFSRRRLLVGFTALSAAAALLAAVWFETHLPRHDTLTSVLEEALDFFGKDNQPIGQPLSTAPAEYRMSRDIVPLQNVRWRHVENFLGGPAVAYDLPTAGGRATLYVVQRTVPGLPSLPPSMPNLSTGGKSAAAWQTGSTLYVLVVDGGAGTYSNYLDHSHGPLT